MIVVVFISTLNCKAYADIQTTDLMNETSNREIIANDTKEAIELLNRSIVLRINSPLSFVYGKKRFIDELNHSFIPIIGDAGRALLPVRFLSDCLGGTTDWNSRTMTATITCNNKTIEIQLGNKYMKVNDEIVELDEPARSESGRTILPARAIAEALDKEVYYNNGFIVISDKGLKLDDTSNEVLNIIQIIRNELSGVNKVDNTNSTFNEKNITSYLYIDENSVPLETPNNKCFLSSSGIYAENLKISKANDNNIRIKMDVYNTMNSYGVIEVYDADYNLIPEKTVQLDRLTGTPTSIKETAEVFWDSTYGFGVALGCLAMGDSSELMYRNPVSGCHTEVDITVPMGGAILITNDMYQSAYVAAYNAIDLAWDSINISKDALSLNEQDFKTFEKSFKKNLAKKIVEKGIKSEQFINAVVADYNITNLVGHINSIVDTAVGIFNNPDINMNDIITESLLESGLDVSIDVGESIFRFFSGIGPAFNAVFFISSTGNYIDFITDLDKTQNGNACVITMPETLGSNMYSADVEIVRDDRSVKNNDKLLAEWYFDKVEIKDKNEVAIKINNYMQKECTDFFNSEMDFRKNVIESPSPYNESYINTYQAKITKNSDGILSIAYKGEWYLGGVYNIDYKGINFDLKTGDNLKLTDIFSVNEEEIENYLKTEVKKYIDNNPDYFWWNDEICNAKDLIENYNLDQFNFYLENENVCLCFSTYELASESVIIKCPII